MACFAWRSLPLLLAAAVSAQAQASEHAPESAGGVTPSPDAEAVIQKIGPSRCHAQTSGYLCMIKVDGKDVGIVVPKNYRGVGKCLAHFHGLRFASFDNTPESTLSYFRFDQALATEAPDTLMIAPVGEHGRANYSLARDYGSLPKLDALWSAVEQLTGQKCQQLTLSGHSAAYKVLSPLLAEAKAKPESPRAASIGPVFLMDALYGSDVSAFSAWVRASPAHQLYNVSRPGSTREHSLEIADVPNYHNQKSEIADHWELVRDRYFAQFLRQSR